MHLLPVLGTTPVEYVPCAIPATTRLTVKAVILVQSARLPHSDALEFLQMTVLRAQVR